MLFSLSLSMYEWQQYYNYIKLIGAVSPFYFSDEQNHHLTLKYDFHSYMIRSMEEEFQRIVGVRWATLSSRNIAWYIQLKLYIYQVLLFNYARFVYRKLHCVNYLLNNFASMIFYSGPLWGFVVAFMLFNIKGFE